MNGPVVLRRGTHADAADGVCLMEHVALVAGEQFSDTPRCTDPVLAMLARLVNDALPDGPRQRLVGFAPRLARARGARPWVASDVVAAALDRVLAVDDVAWWRRLVVQAHRRRAAHRSAWLRPLRPGSLGCADLLYRVPP